MRSDLYHPPMSYTPFIHIISNFNYTIQYMTKNDHGSNKKISPMITPKQNSAIAINHLSEGGTRMDIQACSYGIESA